MYITKKAMTVDLDLFNHGWHFVHSFRFLSFYSFETCKTKTVKVDFRLCLGLIQYSNSKRTHWTMLKTKA